MIRQDYGTYVNFRDSPNELGMVGRYAYSVPNILVGLHRIGLLLLTESKRLYPVVSAGMQISLPDIHRKILHIFIQNTIMKYTV